jgi:uncharacterized membrane protein
MSDNEPIKTNGVDGKVISAVSYLGVIGLIIAFVLSKQNKNELVLFHLKQAAGLSVLAVGLILCCFILIPISFIIPVLLIIVFPAIGIINLSVLVFIVIGILNAVNEKMNYLPIIGKKSDVFFAKYIN